MTNVIFLQFSYYAKHFGKLFSQQIPSSLHLRAYNLILVFTAEAGSEKTKSGRARFRNAFL